jgi:streptomycin 6-kinase
LLITVPEDFAADTVGREGEAGRRWIDGLPELVEALCERWALVVDGAVMHGYLGLVVPVRSGDEPAVLKVSWIDESNADEAVALSAWAGQGAVRLFKADLSLGALLLERLDSRRSLNAVAIDEAVRVAGRLLRRLAVPAPDGVRPLPAVATDLSRNLPERWERYGRPMPRRVLDQARAAAAQLGPSNGKLLVNYDLSYTDVLASERESWLVVDPKVVAGAPEYGPAQLLWRRLDVIEAQGGLERCFRTLCEAAELDLDLARRWTLVRCVDYWLWELSVGWTDDPARCARIISWLGGPI